MSDKSKIIQFGNRTLRQKAASIDVNSLPSSDVDDVILRLKESLPEHGIGLAAPQIDISKRIFIADISKENWTDEKIAPVICINPKVVRYGERIESDWEGCLSLPGIWGEVERSYNIEAQYYNEGGKVVHRELSGVAARVFQHELDHLDGVLFVDRMKDMTTLMTDEEFKKQDKRGGHKSK